MNRKIVKPVAIGLGVVVVVSIGALVTLLSRATAAGDRLLWSVRLMEKIDGIIRFVRKKTRKND